MIIKPLNMETQRNENMRGGDGIISITHLDKKENMKHCRLLASIEIPEGASIGEHQHNAETEYYIIQKGEGIVCDNGTDTSVAAGDVVVTGDGSTHSIRNTGKGTLEMIAVIFTVAE